MLTKRDIALLRYGDNIRLDDGSTVTVEQNCAPKFVYVISELSVDYLLLHGQSVDWCDVDERLTECDGCGTDVLDEYAIIEEDRFVVHCKECALREHLTDR